MWALSDYEASSAEEGNGSGSGREVQQNAQPWPDPQEDLPSPGQQLAAPLLQPQTQQHLQQLPQPRPGCQSPSTLDELLASLGRQPEQQQQQPDVAALQPHGFLSPAVLNQRQQQGRQQGQLKGQQGQERQLQRGQLGRTATPIATAAAGSLPHGSRLLLPRQQRAPAGGHGRGCLTLQQVRQPELAAPFSGAAAASAYGLEAATPAPCAGLAALPPLSLLDEALGMLGTSPAAQRAQQGRDLWEGQLAEQEPGAAVAAWLGGSGAVAAATAAPLPAHDFVAGPPGGAAEDCDQEMLDLPLPGASQPAGPPAIQQWRKQRAQPQQQPRQQQPQLKQQQYHHQERQHHQQHQQQQVPGNGHQRDVHSRGLLDQQPGPQQPLLPQQRRQQRQQQASAEAAKAPAPHMTASAAQQAAAAEAEAEAEAAAAATAAMLPPPPPEGGTPAGSGTVPDIGGGAGGSFVAPTSLAAYLDDQICDALQR